MKKSKFSIPVQKWGTIKSKYQPESNYVSPDEFTSGSNNFITNVSGAIEKRPTDSKYNPATLTNTGKDQFEAIFQNGTHHLLFMDGDTLKYTSGDGVINTFASGYAPTASMEYVTFQNRVYFGNGVNIPGVYDLTTSYGGVPYTFPQPKNMGVFPPTSTATFSTDSAGGSVPIGGHRYKITFLYYGFEESNGSLPTILHTVTGSNQTVNLLTVPIGGYGVTARKIYRDNGDDNYILIGTISNNTDVTFTDTVSAGTTPIPTSNNIPPVFSYIVSNLSRLWCAGISGDPSTIYFSNPGLPDIFDPGNSILCNPKDPITALAVYQGTVYVINRHSFGQILGNTTDTFYYNEFPGSVGCTDIRSIQIRTINGVPILIFLSDRGLYAFNGSSLEYISDAIEDEINLNTQQVTFNTGSQSQSTLGDFQGGSSSPAIDLLSNPGSITTINPITSYQSEADWEGGTLTNVSTNDGSNSIKVPTAFIPSLASGTLTGDALISGGNVTLPVHGSIPGESVSGVSERTIDMGNSDFRNDVSVAYSIVTGNRNGSVNLSMFFSINTFSPETVTIYATLWSDALGTVGSILAQSSPQIFNCPGGAAYFITLTNVAIPYTLIANTTYWLGITAHDPTGIGVAVSQPSITPIPIINSSPVVLSGGNSAAFFDSTWTYPIPFQSGYLYGPGGSVGYTFDPTPISQSGTWVSPIYDSFSNSVTSILTETITGNYGTNCTGTVVIDGSNSPTLSTINTTQTLTNPTGINPLTIFGYRYWRITYNISTTDDRNTITMGPSTLKFATTGTWISPTIDCTADVVSYNTPITNSIIPGGTSVTFTAATSPDNITYSSFVPIGSAIVQRYIKIQVILTATADDTITPSVSLLTFSWNINATFTSSIINIGQIPSGWGIFQDVAYLNGGTVTFYMRSASSLIGLASATYFSVSNGIIPTGSISPLQYSQYKIVFSAGPNTLPEVDSVTINWYFGTQPNPIRAASLFYNKTYYLALAETGQTTNNVVIIWDQEGNWRLWRGFNISSLSLFLNEPYYLDAVRKFLYKWLVAIPTNGSGSAISMDVRTKSFDAQDYDHLKNPRSCRIMGLNTGTTIHVYFSLDRGQTWIEMLNPNGVVGYTTTTDGSKFYTDFVPDYTLGNSLSAVTIMFRVTSTDAYPCKILSMTPEIIVHEGKYIGFPI